MLRNEKGRSVGGQEFDYEWYGLHKQDQYRFRTRVDSQKADEIASYAVFLSKNKVFFDGIKIYANIFFLMSIESLLAELDHT